MSVTVLCLAFAACLLQSSAGEEVADIVKRLDPIVQSNPILRNLWHEHVERNKQAPMPEYDFDCVSSPSPVEPRNVHELRPSDIKVIAAYGDSITAGNGLGADNLIEVAFQNRGESWSVGGDLTLEDKVVTLANILRKFSPNLKGQSYDYSFVWEEEAGFNVAVPGNRARHMPPQSADLIEKLKTYDIDYDNDWKMATLFIGGNDLCSYCRDPDDRSPENYANNIREALDLLHFEVPRMLVNLVPVFDVTPLAEISEDILCDLLQDNFCSCALDEETAPELRPTQLAYYQKIKELVDSGRYDTRDDFTVVLQPYMVDMEPPRN